MKTAIIQLSSLTVLVALFGCASTQPSANTQEHIKDTATTSQVRKFNWANMGGHDEAPGQGPIGYTKGMALSYANAYRHVKGDNSDPYFAAMARKPSADQTGDALYAMRGTLAKRGLHPEMGGVETLRALYVILYEIGLRESNGRYDEGEDVGPGKSPAELARGDSMEAEAGIFGSSWNGASEYPLLKSLFADFAAGKRECYANVFKEGVTPRVMNTVGTGDGAKFQVLAKECPEFAVEFKALELRNKGSDNHFVKTRRLDISSEAKDFFENIEEIVDGRK